MVTLDDQNYVKETLTMVNGFIDDISVDWKTGNIFFTNVRHDFSVRFFVLKNGEKELKAIEGLGPDGYASAVDQTNGVVYIASEEGIYTYDETANKAVPFAAKDYNIMYIDVADMGETIYFVQFEGDKVYKLSAVNRTKIDPFDKIPNAHNLAVDAEGNFYYKDEKIAYMLKKGEAQGRKIENLQYNSRVMDYFVDKHDNVWIASDNGDIYKIDKENVSARLVGNVGFGVISIASDKDDNIIVGNHDSLVKLKKVHTNPCAAV